MAGQHEALVASMEGSTRGDGNQERAPPPLPDGGGNRVSGQLKEDLTGPDGDVAKV